MKNSIAHFLLKIIKAKTSAFVDNGTIFSSQSQHSKPRRYTQTLKCCISTFSFGNFLGLQAAWVDRVGILSCQQENHLNRDTHKFFLIKRIHFWLFLSANRHHWIRKPHSVIKYRRQNFSTYIHMHTWVYKCVYRYIYVINSLSKINMVYYVQFTFLEILFYFLQKCTR